MKFELSRFREETLGLSQKEFAKLMTLEVSELMDLESRKSLDTKHLRKIMEVTGLSFEEIAFFDRKKTPMLLAGEPTWDNRFAR